MPAEGGRGHLLPTNRWNVDRSRRALLQALWKEVGVRGRWQSGSRAQDQSHSLRARPMAVRVWLENRRSDPGAERGAGTPLPAQFRATGLAGPELLFATGSRAACN